MSDTADAMGFCARLMRYIDSKPLTPKPESNLSVAQNNFLKLHAQHLVDRWQWHFLETQLRAHAGERHSATIWRDELDDLVSRGLMERSHGFVMQITNAGRQAAMFGGLHC